MTARFRALYVGALWLPLCVALVGTKVHKATILGGMTPMGAVAMLGADALLLGLLAGASYLALAAPRNAGRVALVAFHVVFPVLLVLAVVEHVFFLISGAVGDWYLLKDTILRFGALAKLLGSQLDPLRAALLVSPVVWSAVVYGIGWRLRRRRDEAPDVRAPSRARTGALGISAALVVVGTAAVFLPISETARPIKRNIYLGVTGELLGDVLSSADLDAAVIGDASQAPRSPSSLVPTGEGAKNLVFIVLESTGARHTSLYGAHDTTPFLKRLAAQGATVERAYTVFPHTSKALVGIQCGVHPAPVPGVPEATPGGMPVTCLARLLRDQGFATAFFQTAEENYERRSFLVDEFGFERFVGKESIPAHDFEESNYFGWEDDAMLEPILDWVDAQQGRFFLSALTLTSHHPYGVPLGFDSQRFTDDKVLNDYLNTVRYTDRFVQRLYEGFEARGLAKDTVFVVLGDHGEAFGEHGRSQHTPVPYDEALRVPMVLAGPGITAGSRIEGLRQSVDLAPTAARLLGFEPRGGSFYGVDLLGEPHDRLFYHCGYHEYCMGFVWPEDKLIYHFERRRPEVYDLEVDPLERNDLYRAPEPALTARMQAAIGKLRSVRAATLASYQNQTKRRLPRFVHTALPDDVGAAMDVELGGFVRVRGVSVEPARIEAGGRAVITTWYEVVEDPPDGWLTFHHLLGTSYLNADHVPVEGAYPVNRWERGDVIEDRHVFTTRPDAQPGKWDVTLGLWRKLPSGSERASVVVREGPAVARPDQRVVVGALEVTAPQLDPSEFVSVTPPPGALIDMRFGEDFGLVRAGVERPDSKGGLKVTQEYIWQVLRKPEQGRYEFLVQVEGRRRRALTHEPLGGTWPVSSWEVGQFIRDPQGIISKTDDPLGDYTIWLTVKRDGVPLQPVGEGLPVDGVRVRVGGYALGR